MVKERGAIPSAGERAARQWVALNQVGRGLKDRTLVGALASLIEAVGAKDPYTQGHSLRVARYAAAIAKELGLSKADRREIALAAELHDVGKIGVPDELLCKPGPLSEAERVRVLDHTLIGERILAPLLAGRWVILGVVRWHHERVDGTGYPDGLRGEEIPLAARIVAVADAFDAMRTARPYRRSLSGRAAIAELVRAAGSQFDPRCVQALLQVLRKRALARRGSSGSPAVRSVPVALCPKTRWWPRRLAGWKPQGTGPPAASLEVARLAMYWRGVAQRI
jgi:HD-GYP domain-containing protein (c-di-GMP phosphodiesterase class II)